MITLKSFQSNNNESQKEFKIQNGFEIVLKVIFKRFDYNKNNNEKYKDKNNNKSMTLNKIWSDVIIFIGNFYKFYIFIKKKFLKQGAINKKTCYARLEI